MRRRGISFCADIDPKRFDLFQQRNQLPFPSRGGDSYTLEDAFNLRLFLDALDDHGVSLDLARYAVQNGVRELSMHPLRYPRSHGDMWVAAGMKAEPVKPGYEHALEDLPRSGDFVLTRFRVAGRLEDIHRLAAEECGHHEGYKVEGTGRQIELVRLVALNASRAADFVRDRARELGLPEGDDYTQPPGGEWPAWMAEDFEKAREIDEDLAACLRKERDS